MKALISVIEVSHSGHRIAEIAEVEFEVAEPLFWVDCDNTITTSNHYFLDGVFFEIPKPVITQPCSTGLVEI